ncbi:MAG TPA: hypothetical protein VN538_05095 [Clostridia bacterium]|nr:hypothetical protein [Clostridia bacterium]
MAKIPTLTKFIVLSMMAIIAYTVVLLWLRVKYDFWIDTEYSRLWYGFWGSEIFICSELKTGKLILGRINPFIMQNSKTETNSDDAVG